MTQYSARHPVDGFSEAYAQHWLERSFARKAQDRKLTFGPLMFWREGRYLVAEAETL